MYCKPSCRLRAIVLAELRASQVHPTLRTPLRALGLTAVMTMLLLLIPIGSYTAFNAILSLAVIALYFSYTMPCLFVFMQRLNGERIAHTGFTLGRWRVWVDGAASVYGLFVIIWLCFLTELPVTAKNMNWSGPIMGFVDYLFPCGLGPPREP